jgi:MFS family permease
LTPSEGRNNIENLSQPQLSNLETPASSARPKLGYAWYVVFALTSIYMLSFVDRQILSLLVGPMKRDLGLSDTKVGLLQGLAFGVFYTLVGLPLGRLADTRNRRNLIAAGVVAWSFFTSSCSVARSFFTLFLARMGVGVGEATLSPSAYSLISDYFPKDRLGTAISVFYMGVFFGSSLSLLVTGAVLDALSHTPFITVPLLGSIAAWRVVFLVVGLPGVLFALLVYTIREPVRRDLLRTADHRTASLTFGESVSQIKRRIHSFAGLAIGSVFQSAPTYALTFWFPTFLQRTHHWTPGQSGRALAAILLTFGCLGMFAGGKLSDHWQRNGKPEGPLRVGVICAIGTALLVMPAMLLPDAAWTLALMAPGVFFLALPMGTTAAALQHIFPNQVRGLVSSFYLFVLNLGGLSIGPLMPGLLNDRLFHDEKMIGPSIAITVGASALLMLGAFWFGIAPYRRDYRLMERESVTA